MSSADQDREEQSLDVNLLKEIAKKELINALNSVNGAKTLALDATLAGPLGLVTEVALLKIYLFHRMQDQIKRHVKESRKHTYTLLLVPRVSTLVSRILEEEGVLGEVSISAFNLQFIPLSDDVISLEYDNAFKELWVDGDETVVFDSAQALVSLQKLFGPFPQIRLEGLVTRQGKLSQSAVEPVLSSSANIDSLIILDRRVDLITPLLTQLTYEGLVDELIGIRNSHVELPVSLVNPPAPNTASGSAAASTSNAPIVNVKKDAKKKYHLATSTDPLYAELRDLNFSSVGRKLNAVARRLDEDYKTNLQAKSVAQLRDFVGKLGGLQTEHQSLRLHTGLSELILPLTRTDVFNKSLEIQQNLLASYETSAQIIAIEELISQGADMQIVIRLLCLASITIGGIKTKALESLKRDILQAYGYENLPLLLSLASPSLSMLAPIPLPPSAPQTPKYPFSSLRKSLRLLIDDNPEALEEVENDISFVYSGWAPISVRLVQCIAQKGGVLSNPAEREKGAGEQSKASISKVQAHPIVGWKGFEDIVSSIPGETVQTVQRQFDETGSGNPPMSANLPLREQTSTTVVFFLGGCTYTEIAAIRWVSRQNKGRRFLIATTGIINGASLVESMTAGGRSGEPKVGTAQ
ncbi:ATP binding protein [Coprinopsis marcescibilis]|uniref:ATP binding protein n=1 Tax=Coprinopsis marcescibilis TaxID=230819 RepID=A0A5C3L279_COPMA|nr:ATP binding protein [Coprinopsis marcescibilis]